MVLVPAAMEGDLDTFVVYVKRAVRELPRHTYSIHHRFHTADIAEDKQTTFFF